MRFHTTPEIAARGVKEYGAIVPELPHVARIKFLLNPRIRRCFVGTSPVIGDCDPGLIGDLDYGEYCETRRVMAGFSKNITIIQLNNRKEDLPRIVLANLAAVRNVMRANRHLFPRMARENAGHWLKSRAEKWRDINGGHDHSIRNGLLSGYPDESVAMYADRFGVRRDRRTIQTDAFGGFVLFGNSHEGKYLSEGERIYRESGIDEVARELTIKYGV